MPRPFTLKSTLMGAGALTLIGLTAGAIPANAADRSVIKTPASKTALSGQAAPERILVADNNRRERSRDRTRTDRSTTRDRDSRTTQNRDRTTTRNNNDRRRTTAQRDDRRRTTTRQDVRRNTTIRRDNNRRDYARLNQRRTSNHNGYRSNYRSALGINFIFGNTGYSRYRWAPTDFAFYNTGYGSYRNYTRNTFCQRIVVEGYHYGRLTPISVKQCSNPWDGTYIVQGSERLVRGYY